MICSTKEPTIVSISSSILQRADDLFKSSDDSPAVNPDNWDIVYGASKASYASYDESCTYDKTKAVAQECGSSLKTNSLIITPEFCISGKPILLKQ